MRFVVRAAHPHEYSAIAALVGRVFAPSESEARIVTTTLQRDTAFRREHLRVAEIANQVIAMALMIDRPIRMGRATVRGVIIAPVATIQEYQGQGASSAIMREMLQWARISGYDLAMLWGHLWLYPRYGFAPGLKHYCVTMEGRYESGEQGALTVRAMDNADLPALVECYDVATPEPLLLPRRSASGWEWRPVDANQRMDVVVDGAEHLRGYVRWYRGPEGVVAQEIAAKDDTAAGVLTAHLSQQAEGRRVEVQATPDNRWTRRAWRDGAAVTVGNGGGHGMVRILDLPRFLTAMLPELNQRVSRSEWAIASGAVKVVSPAGSATIRVDRGRVQIDDTPAPSVTAPFPVLGPLVSGYRPITDLLHEPGVQVEDRRGIRLLEVLFPEGYPHWPIAAYF